MLATEFEKKLAFDLRASWQARVFGEAKGMDFAVVMSVLAHSFSGESVLVLLHILMPDFDGRAPGPYLATAGKVAKDGTIVADVIDPLTGRIRKDAVLYAGEIHLGSNMRRLADRLKLTDRDRAEFFTAVRAWVVADRRLDPNFDPKDPDAKRIH